MDQELLVILYGQYRLEIFRYLYGLTRSFELAEDLCQETFVKALLSLPDEHRNVRAWLYQVARNLCINEMKRQKRYQEVMQAQERAESNQSIAAGLEELAVRNEQLEELARALAKLEFRKREVLLLQYYSGLSQKEIASLLHMKVDHVRVMAHRAKKELKRIMEDIQDDI